MDDQARFEAWWFAAPDGESSYEQVYGRSYREIALMAWKKAVDTTTPQSADDQTHE